MADETKEPQTPPQAEAAEKAPQAEAKAEGKTETKKEAPPKVTPTNCCVCNKSIKKIRWYYRNGKHYCTKRCWLTAKKKDAAKPAEGQPAEQK